MSPLDALLVETTDTAQVWEQMQLMNLPNLSFLANECERLLRISADMDADVFSSGSEFSSEESESHSERELEPFKASLNDVQSKKLAKIAKKENKALNEMMKSKKDSKKQKDTTNESEDSDGGFSSESDDGIEMNSDDDNANGN